METIPEDAFNNLTAYLDRNTLNTLNIVSKGMKQNLVIAAQEPVALKKRIEVVTGVNNLPFITDEVSVEYLQGIVRDLDTHSLTDLYHSGKYEYVCIAHARGMDNPNGNYKAMMNAVDADRVDTIDFMLTNSSPLDDFDKIDALNTAIKIGSNRVMYRLLEDMNRDTILYVVDDITNSPLIESLMSGNFVAFKAMLTKFPLFVSETHVLRDISRAISISADITDRVSFLAYFLDVYKEFDLHIFLSDYARGRRDKGAISEPEMHLILESNVFRIDSDLYLDRCLSPEASYLLYTTSRTNNIVTDYILDPSGIPSVQQEKLLVKLVSNSNLLVKALDYAKPLNPDADIIAAALIKGEEPINIILNRCEVSKDHVKDAISKTLRLAFSVNAIIILCQQVGITTQDLELMIMTDYGKFDKEYISRILQLGVPLGRPGSRQLVGEKIAFNSSPEVWEELYRAGFDFDACGTDLLIVYGKTDPNILFKYVKRFDKTIDYPYIIGYPEYAIWTEHGVKPTNTRNTKLLLDYDEADPYFEPEYNLESLKDGDIVWKNVRKYKWLDGITPDLAKYVTKGIPIMQRNLENEIIRGYINSAFYLQDFTAWLKLATGLTKEVSISSNATRITITIGDVKVSLSFHLLKGSKYRGLDLFSRSGRVLTTKDEVRARRKELQAKLPQQ